jgi:Holliday junction DNA helicase RuvA
MYHHIKGRLIEKNPAFVVIEANGMGFLVNISVNTYSQIEGQDNVQLYTHLIVREDAWQLFGFHSKQERTTFQLLISVSGVGPNTARVILSSLSPSEVEAAIATANVGLLTAVKGIGAKTAQRIVVDLKDKTGKGIFSDHEAVKGGFSERIEAVSALEILGFNRLQVEKVVNGLLQAQPDMSVEQIVKEALKKL